VWVSEGLYSCTPKRFGVRSAGLGSALVGRASPSLLASLPPVLHPPPHALDTGKMAPCCAYCPIGGHGMAGDYEGRGEAMRAAVAACGQPPPIIPLSHHSTDNLQRLLGPSKGQGKSLPCPSKGR
jgi:hypothetical protein